MVEPVVVKVEQFSFQLNSNEREKNGTCERRQNCEKKVRSNKKYPSVRRVVDDFFLQIALERYFLAAKNLNWHSVIELKTRKETNFVHFCCCTGQLKLRR